LDEVFGPSGAISKEATYDKWRALSYESTGCNGVLLSAIGESAPPPLTMNPGLSGWHKIFICLQKHCFDNDGFLRIRLSGDAAPSLLQVSAKTINEPDPDIVWLWYQPQLLEEGLWKCADMTSQSLAIEKAANMAGQSVAVAWVRFVPMTETEIAAYKAEWSRPEDKRLFVSCDMWGCVGFHAPEKEDEWMAIPESLRNSDVGKISIEMLPPFPVLELHNNRIDEVYAEPVRKKISELLEKKDNSRILPAMTAYGQKMGLEIYIALRMGLSSFDGLYLDVYPYNTNEKGRSFVGIHPELRCVDRDGSVYEIASYAFPESRRFVIDRLSQCASYGCDGVALYFTRGIPFVLFEEPVIRRFRESYNCDPREIPLVDPRVHETQCSFMTEFMRELRSRLDKENERRVKIHAHVGLSPAHSKVFALDVETWAKEGLIDSIEVDDLKMIERLDGIMQDNAPELIDLKKYTARSMKEWYGVMKRRIYPRPDALIPKECIAEYENLSKKYGIEVYYHVLPHCMSPKAYREYAMEMYKLGAQRFFLWDVELVNFHMAEWCMARRLGHKDSIAGYKDFRGSEWETYRITSIGGKLITNYHPSWIT
jgi:hypothetical protein